MRLTYAQPFIMPRATSTNHTDAKQKQLLRAQQSLNQFNNNPVGSSQLAVSLDL